MVVESGMNCVSVVEIGRLEMLVMWCVENVVLKLELGDWVVCL